MWGIGKVTKGTYKSISHELVSLAIDINGISTGNDEDPFLLKGVPMMVTPEVRAFFFF